MGSPWVLHVQYVETLLVKTLSRFVEQVLPLIKFALHQCVYSTAYSVLSECL